jgi:hypothetical protein
VPHVSSGTERSFLTNLLVAARCSLYSHFNNCATFFTLKQTRKRVKNWHTCNKVYHIKICNNNGSCITQEGHEKSVQHEDNMRGADDLEGWA